MPIRKPHALSIILLAAALLMSGCGDSSNRTNDTTTSNAANPPAAANVNEPASGDGNAAASDNPPANGGTNVAPGTGTETETETGANEPAAKPTEPETQPDSNPVQTPDPEPAKKLYKMNKVYSFVPIDKAATSNKVVLLTFDDGPKEDKMISSLLDTLDKHKAKAIFFVNGYRVKAHPELLKKIADRGQTIGNHSWDHIDLKKESQASVQKQVGDVQKIVKDVIGTEPVFFRPPFGSGNADVKKVVRDHGMLYMTWSNGSLDWDSSTKNKPDKVIANVLEPLHPGVNILMHELPWTTEALDELLTKLESKGYGFIDPATIDLGLEEQTQQTAK